MMPAITTPRPEVEFEIKSSPITSFAALVAARTEVFRNRQSLEAFKNQVAALSTSGDEGRRRALGLWMVGDFEGAAAALPRFADDNVAAFTLARTLMTLGRYDDALPIFERLSKNYPDEPRPRAGIIEARLESDLAKGDEDAAADRLEKELSKAPPTFGASAEGLHLRGRLAELRHELEEAMELFEQSRELDPSHRTNLFRLGYVAERAGEDHTALDAYHTLARMMPIDRNALINLGVLLEDMGRDQDAAACYDTAAKSYPTDRSLRLYLEDARSGMSMYYDEDMERKQDRLDQILRIPITDFELSVRARNCLNKMNIVTLGDLVRQTEQELLSYKNFGETSLNEIKEILGSKGLRLGMQRDEAVASIDLSRRRYTGGGESSDLLNKPVSDLELSIRARRTVEALRCLTVGDIVQHSEDELLGMPNFGVTSLQELKNKLGEMGLKLKPKGV